MNESFHFGNGQGFYLYKNIVRGKFLQCNFVEKLQKITNQNNLFSFRFTNEILKS